MLVISQILENYKYLNGKRKMDFKIREKIMNILEGETLHIK